MPFAVLAAIVAGAVPLVAQYEGSLSVNAVVVPVTVRDNRGRVVSRVGDARFQLYVDGMRVPIRDFSRETDLPISLGFILDTSGSMAGRKITAASDLAMAFLDERRPDDQLALWTFGDRRVQERFPFGMSWYLLPRVLEGLKPWSTTALYDMIRRVPDVMERADHHRRAAILVTDGVDNASRISADEATAIAEHLRTPIYVLGVEPPPSVDGLDGPSYEQVLAMISESSGGYYRRVPRLTEMPEVAQNLLEELSSRYILTFETSGVGDEKWRTLEVRVDGYRATSRRGYHGTLP
jgi:Ca-activated chloride channel family protein